MCFDCFTISQKTFRRRAHAPTPKIPSGIQEILEGMATKTRSCEAIQNVCVSVSVWIRVVDLSVETKERTRFEGGKTLDTLERSQDERYMYGFD